MQWFRNRGLFVAKNSFLSLMHQFKMGQTFKMGQAKSNSKHLQATDLYLVQETWKFLFLTYIYSIVCAYHIGGLFVKCPPYQMATHNLKIFNFFLWFYIGKYLKCLKEFSHWLRKHVLWFKYMSFCNHWLEPTCFFGLKRGVFNFF